MTEPVWVPSAERIERAAITRFMHEIAHACDPWVSDYESLYQFSITHPRMFWQAVWEFCSVAADERDTEIVDDISRMPGARWFPKARLNFAQNLLRFNSGDDAERVAIHFRGESGVAEDITFGELHQQVADFAAGLKAMGIEPGDRVAGFLPNLPQAIIGMLASASIGAIWSSCSPDFGVNGVVDRFGQIRPRVLITANGYYYNGKRHDCRQRVASIVERVPGIERVVVVPYGEPDCEIDALDIAVAWADFAQASDHLEFAQLPFDHPLYIMYSSGTTGVPKCIVHSAGGTLLQHLKELRLHTDVGIDDRLFYFTTCGWMMWNWLVSGLATGATVVLYDGSPFYPDGNRLFDLIDELDITVFGTSAKYLSAVEKAGLNPATSHELASLRTILSTGSPLMAESYDFVYDKIKANVLLASIAGGTDIISCFVLGCPTLPVYRGEIQCRGLGMKVEILNDKAEPVVAEKGELACTLPFPSMPIGFWNDEDGQRYHQAYFAQVPGVWCHGDHAELTPRGGIIIYGRSDATLNPGGVRIGTAEIYRQVEKLDEVVESIAIGQEWDDDVRVVLFVRLRAGVVLDEALETAIRKQIRANTTPRHVPARIVQVTDIPRTISGKIVELAVREVVHGREVKNKDALANPEALELFRDREELRS
ncbi:MAG: acetoacetyl-CoA synthetase [Lysobacteraceae bacterium]|nr:MAG: acetoacetyl-CoA synthetase [Xanthomonadaceae bacterium]